MFYDESDDLTQVSSPNWKGGCVTMVVIFALVILITFAVYGVISFMGF